MKLTHEFISKLCVNNSTEQMRRIPDDPTFDLHFFIPREAYFNLPDNLPNLKSFTFMFGSHDHPTMYSDFKKIGNVIFFKNSWLFYFMSDIETNITNINHKNYEKFIISMNNKPHPHRQYAMKYLEEFGLLGYCYYSWIKPTFNDIWNSSNKQMLLESQQFVKESYNSDFQNTIPTEYVNSFIDIVNETTVDVTFMTEKTWRPLLFGKPFLVNGSKNFHKDLQSMGFLLYDDIFDYSFDSIENSVNRVYEMIKMVSLLKNKDINSMYEKIYEKLKYNQQLCFKMIENEVGVPNIESFFDHLWKIDVINSKNKLSKIKPIISI